jgi:hypothetical protein
MGDFTGMAKIIIGIGSFLIITGIIILFLGKFTGFGRLPGDIFYQKGNFTFYFPLATSILISIILTIVLNLFLRR